MEENYGVDDDDLSLVDSHAGADEHDHMLENSPRSMLGSEGKGSAPSRGSNQSKNSNLSGMSNGSSPRGGGMRVPGSGASVGSFQHFMVRAAACEFIAAFFLTFMALSCIYASNLTGDDALSSGSLLFIAVGYGFTYGTLVYAFSTSGGGYVPSIRQLNPALTIALWLLGKVDSVKAMILILAQHFGRERRERNNALVYELPSELNILPLLLFHVRRGPLLGPILQHEDDVNVCRFQFLHANRQDSLRVCVPTLLSFNSSGVLEELPMETLALQSQRILLLDHQQQILIWSGSEVKGPEYDAYRHACIQRAQSQSLYRLPRPEILSFNEGSSASRWLQVRLIPSHKDSEEWQNLTFPQLKTLSPAQRQELIDKFLPTDEISFVQYYFQIFNNKSN